MRARTLVGAAAAALLSPVLAMAPASAADVTPAEPFAPSDSESTVVDHDTVRLMLTAANTDGTSVETDNLDRPIQAGETISFTYTLADGAVCSAGAPRVFAEVGGTFYNSFDGNADQCGGADNVVTFTIPVNGRIGAVGVVYDNVAAPGTVTVSDLTVDGDLVLFEPRDPEPEPPTRIEASLRATSPEFRTDKLRVGTSPDAPDARVRYFRVRDNGSLAFITERATGPAGNSQLFVNDRTPRTPTEYVARVLATSTTTGDAVRDTAR